MPLKFWEDAFLAAVYLINRTPSKILEYKTPFERLFHKKPDYTSLCIFGCACWPNLRPYNTHKLEFCSRRCVFLGYSILHKGLSVLTLAPDAFPYRVMSPLMKIYFHSLNSIPMQDDILERRFPC
jgi:hypothetical protein